MRCLAGGSFEHPRKMRPAVAALTRHFVKRKVGIEPSLHAAYDPSKDAVRQRGEIHPPCLLRRATEKQQACRKRDR